MEVRRHLVPRIAVGLFVSSLPFVAGWLMGDMSSPGHGHIPEDRGVQPIGFSPGVAWFLGSLCTALTIGSGWVIRRSMRFGLLQRAWLPLIVMVSLAGVMLAYAYRVFTAAVDGANIGAGLLLVFGGPLFCIYLLVTAVIGVRTYFRLARKAEERSRRRT